jgi:hypothetical protein
VGASQLVHAATRIEKSSHELLRMRSAQLIEELVAASNRACAAVDQLLHERERRKQDPWFAVVGGQSYFGLRFLI